jgi:hypothetical protein
MDSEPSKSVALASAAVSDNQANEQDQLIVESKGFKQLAYEWLFRQKTETILIFAIVAGGYYGFPVFLKQIQDGYERQARVLKEAADNFDRDQERDNKLMLRLLDHRLGDRTPPATPAAPKP